MVTNCLNDTALFRYLDNKLLHNIETGGGIVSSYGEYQNRLFVYDGRNQAGRSFQNNNDHRMKQLLGPYIFTKWIIVFNLMDSMLTWETFHAATQQNKSLLLVRFLHLIVKGLHVKLTFVSFCTAINHSDYDIKCSPTQHMVIHKAHYGDFDDAGTFNINAIIDMKCSRQASCQVKSLCGGNRSCELAIDNDLLGYCRTSHYMWTCRAHTWFA